jgi:hypothetical protein
LEWSAVADLLVLLAESPQRWLLCLRMRMELASDTVLLILGS